MSCRSIRRTLLLVVLALAATSPGTAQVGVNGGILNPNLASRDDLLTVPGMTEGLADRLIEARPFLAMSRLHSVLSSTLSEEQAETAYGKLFLTLNLNTASRDEILLIPGVGPRMAHEFEEYRPYKVLAQFRREIGKYVDDDEVARLEQYVFVPINLNSASDEAILSIPGVGKRMLHEFKEYRPYRVIEQFQREIGKYVDDDELARLERYVVIE